jgi:AraC family transcriptional regulator
MEPLNQLNQALRYIESNLAGEIDFQKVSQLACCSEYHFRRMFSFLSGMTLSEYIRHRRLSQAALELRDSDIKVIDLAVKYGYDSPDSFTRAFQGLHGLTPTDARMEGGLLKSGSAYDVSTNHQWRKRNGLSHHRKRSVLYCRYQEKGLIAI